MDDHARKPGRLSHRWQRPLIWIAAGTLALVLLAAASWLAVTETRGGRAWALGKLQAAAAAQGIALSVDDFALFARRGELILTDVRAGTPGARPILSVRRIRVTLDLGSLRGDLLRIPTVEIEEPHLDLGAPLPRLQSQTASASSKRRVEVGSFSLRGGTVTGGTLPTAAAPHATGYRLSGLELDGSWLAGVASATIRLGQLAVERPAAPPLTFAGSARLEAPDLDHVTVHALDLTGDALSLSVSGQATLRPALALTAQGRASGRPALLAPTLASAGEVTLEGRVAYPAGGGHLAVTARDVSGRDLRAIVPHEWFEKIALAETTIEIEGEVDLGPGSFQRVSGAVDLRCRRRDERVLTARVELPPAPGAELQAELRAELLPDLPGSRVLTGRLVAPSWQRLLDARSEGATLELAVPDLPAGLAALRLRYPGLVPDLPADVPVVGALHATANVTGTLWTPRARLEATWLPEATARITVVASGYPMQRSGEGTLTAEKVPIGVLRPGATGVVDGTISITLSPSTWAATLRLDGHDVALASDAPRLQQVHLVADSDARTLYLRELNGIVLGRRFTAAGHATLERPLRTVELAARVTDVAPDVPELEARARLLDGTVFLDVQAGQSPAGPLAMQVELPLGALTAFPELASRLAAIPVERALGPVHVTAWAPQLDTCVLLPAAGLPDRPERGTTALAAELWVDPADVAGASGTVRLDDLRLNGGEHVVAALGPTRLRLGGYRAILDPLRLMVDQLPLDLTGGVTLARGWRPGDPPARLVTAMAGEVHGLVPAAVLTPYLVGSMASGTIQVEATIEGTPAAPRARARISGPDVMLYWPTPYATRVEAPAFDVVWENGMAEVPAGQLRLNGGRVDFDGGFDGESVAVLRLRLANVNYRLAFGVRTTLSGELQLIQPFDDRGYLSGALVVERGVLDRDLNLEREVLPRFLAPVQTAGTETNRLDRIDLDVVVATTDGIRVKNNLADLHASWQPMRVSGTAWNPAIVGTVEVDPGGLVFAYGQTLRLDRATAAFTGDPVNDPRLDLATTSSRSDSSIVPLAGAARPVSELEGPDQGGTSMTTLAAGVGNYLGEKLGSQLGETLGLGQISIRPILVFGEADPSARLSISRELSRYVTFAMSLDLRNTDRQTYLLDLHGFRRLPRLVAQALSNDEGNPGATLQQVLDFPRTRRTGGTLPELGKVVIETDPRIKASRLRKAITLKPGDGVPASAAFDAEVEVLQALRDLGFPEATVAVAVTPSPKRAERRDLEIRVSPGPRVTVEFSGDVPPKALRGPIASLYRTDYYEAASLEEMEHATTRALRSLGHLDPSARISVARAASGDRTVTVACAGGRRVNVSAVEFVGIPPEEAVVLARRFAGPLERTELVAATADADRRVTDVLRALGYAAPRLTAREIRETDRHLIVTLVAGPQTRVGSIILQGVPAPEEERLPLNVGDPARADRVAEAAMTLEQDLLARGHADARVRSTLTGAGQDLATVTFTVAAGPPSKLGQVEFQGLRFTSPRFAARLADLEPGTPFDLAAVYQARARLFDSGLFNAVTFTTSRTGDHTGLSFRVAEKPRFSVAYGLRWESEVGLSAVVDLIDRNLLGRNLMTGLRVRYEPKDRSARLYLAAPGLLDTGATLETYVEARRQQQTIIGFYSDTIRDSLLATLQLSKTLGRTVTARIYGRYSRVHVYELEPDPFLPYDMVIKHPYLGGQLLLDTRDDPVLGSRGVFASLDVSGSASFLSSDFDYLRAFGQINLTTPVLTLGSVRLTWAQSVRVGVARAFRGQDLLPDVRFFGGGEYSVRGYPLESLGPYELGEPKGGAAVLVINEELRVPLIWDTTGVVFFDAGQVYDTTGELGRQLAKAAGLGLRARTPVGVLRLDLAVPLDRRPDDPSFKAYVGFGSVF